MNWKKTYYVSYVYVDSKGSVGFGWIIYPAFSGSMATEHDVERLIESVKRYNPRAADVVPMFWTELEG